MTLTPDQIGQLVVVVIVLISAISNYLNHLSLVNKVQVTDAKVDAVGSIVNGQAHAVTVAAVELARQASISAALNTAAVSHLTGTPVVPMDIPESVAAISTAIQHDTSTRDSAKS